ncbi:MAG: 2-oxoglutarate dehydrogenase E1 component [Legionellaceae bacterium]|nr:2-oxoglutarate dehydrogenase E1 component [Legionellaceae bacterium]MBP9775657.1 2-oxoglutarate dehydrogenase E1 component [Legionellaceae bacterium]
MSLSTLQQQMASSYLSGGNTYVEALYEDYLSDPSTVLEEWRAIFDALPKISGQPELSHRDIQDQFLQLASMPKTMSVESAPKQQAVTDLIQAYRSYGHLQANLDPLGMAARRTHPSLDPHYYHLGDADRSQVFSAGPYLAQQPLTLAEIERSLQATYCGSIGIQYMHLSNQDEIAWIQQYFESNHGRPQFQTEQKIKILKDLIAADGLERYLGTRYVGQKRFSLEGGDALIPLMNELIQNSCAAHIDEIVIGMAHRGRLNVLINVLGKTPDSLFQEFEGKYDATRTGDVKYHLGYSSDLSTQEDAVAHVVLAFNPSHLEIISPVVEGSSRSRMRRLHDLESKNKVLPIVLHGDAAFTGQGVVMETFNFSQSPGYCTGGTVHIVINNQIGFTTSNPQDARSTDYCTDIAKMVEAPILHVNGDDPEAVVFIIQLAFAFRMAFKRDVVVDLICYRRHGHNEADEPAITQPMMYQRIKQIQPLRELYAAQLVQEKIVTAEEVQIWNDAYRDALDSGESVVASLQTNYQRPHAPDWSPYFGAQWTDEVKTAVDKKTLQSVAEKLLVLPEDFVVHPVVKRLLEERQKMGAGELAMNWGFAETMAYATILQDGHEVRLSGQDCGRGTFAHRHAVLYDQKTGQGCTPLQKFATNSVNSFSVIDSVLSEEAVLAFEYGYATYDPSSLVIWEAQFGDFANGAQVVIDQFISSGEQKWGRLCGLVMLLPHGYEGQGPEHSSARLERFMQLCAQQNIQVCTPTTPAQIFHLLRRQVLRKFRKPLIVMTPKSILRHKLAVSTLEDLAQGKFQVVIAEQDQLDAAKVTTVVLCCGKVYYDLLQHRRAENLQQHAIIRIEQLYPFPTQALMDVLKTYPNAKTIVWCQEEPKNQGVWFSSQHHFKECLRPDQTLTYAGRGFAAAPAGGSAKTHSEQQEVLVKQALT